MAVIITMQITTEQKESLYVTKLAHKVESRFENIKILTDLIIM